MLNIIWLPCMCVVGAGWLTSIVRRAQTVCQPQKMNRFSFVAFKVSRRGRKKTIPLNEVLWNKLKLGQFPSNSTMSAHKKNSALQSLWVNRKNTFFEFLIMFCFFLVGKRFHWKFQSTTENVCFIAGRDWCHKVVNPFKHFYCGLTQSRILLNVSFTFNRLVCYTQTANKKKLLNSRLIS